MADMTEHVRRDAFAVCLSCGYDLVGAAGPVCPECGYEVTEEDVALDERRRALIELAPGSIAWRMLPVAAALAFVWVWPIIFVVQGVLAGWVLVYGLPRLHARVLVRVWLMSLIWLQMIWLVPAAVARGDGWLWWLDVLSPYPRYGSSVAGWGYGAALIGLAVGLGVWWWSWRRLCRAAGMPRGIWSRARVRKALWIAVGPQGMIVVGIVAAAVLARLSDRVAPGWDL